MISMLHLQRSGKWLIFGGLIFQACTTQAPQQQAPLSFSEFQKHEAQITPTGVTTSAATSIAEPDGCSTVKCRELRQEFRYVVYVGKQIYAYWDLKKADTGIDYDALSKTLESSIVDSTSETAYYKTLRLWASSLHDGHVNAMAKSGWTEAEAYTATVRLEVFGAATDHEKVHVVNLDEGIDGISVGDEVTAIDGVPIAKALDEAEKTVSGSTRRMRRYNATRRLVDALGVDASAHPLVLSVIHAGATTEVSIPRNVLLTEKSDGSSDEKETSGVENIKARILPGNLGYLRIDAFMGAQDDFLLEQSMNRLSQTNGLLLDLRKNGGGDLSGNSILEFLSANPLVRYQTSTSLDDFLIAQRPQAFFLPSIPGDRFSQWIDVKVAPKNPLYGKPVVALTSPYCFSACDTFSAGLKANGLATFVGEATGGGTGTPLVFSLPVSGHQFRYSVVRGRTAKGDFIEGVGTSPDVVIEPTIEERTAHKDLQLLKALAVLQSKISPGSTTAPASMDGSMSQALRGLDLVWEQRLDQSPTVEDENRLRKIAPIDEIQR